jgi:phosphoglycerate dehydrogenase-like enzyme
MSFKMVFLPPNSQDTLNFVARLQDSVTDANLVSPSDEDAAVAELADADAAFGTMNPRMVAAAPKLRWLQAPAAAPPAGYYFDELIAHPTQVTNFREIYNDHISVHIVAMMLSFVKHLNIYRDQQRDRHWNKLVGAPYNSIFLPDSTVVIVGVGGIGTETARLCKALGCKVIGIDARWESPDAQEHVDEMRDPSELDDVLSDGDFVVLTIPHTPQTEGLFDAGKFALMKSSAIFINIGRGMTTKLDDLNDALRNGVIGGAGLDVYEIEPLPADHPLWDAPNTILTPHIAADEGRYLGERRYEVVADNMRRFAAGEPLRNLVDKENWF